MLESFQINNFRLFQHLEVGRLSRVNLVVGRNNAGKSTFLEAVELYASNASSTVLLDLVESRQETWFSEVQLHSQNFFDNPMRHLFFGHKLPRIGEEGISLGEVSSHTKIHIGAAVYQNKNDDEGTIRKIRISDVQFDEDLSNVEVFLVAEEGKRTRRLFRLARDVRDIRHSSRMLYGRQESEFKYTWQIVSTENMPNRKLAALWDLTSLTDLESEVISALHLIDDRISGVAFVEDISQKRSGDNRIPLVKIKGIDEPLPLKSMGDGITRLFHIIVALVNARNGLLLIDEFENGLHWSVQPKVWDIVFQLANRLNVQVFATTHSRDCIEGFNHAWNKYPALGAFFRLDAKAGLIKATEYTSETLTDAIDMDVEVR
ncbi:MULTISPECIES: AAA family ATPase [unclassified Coleofasciculus]|uniref:AAA family ATPase n=1 Tax=unclassified Coleofasciculus TaxID=2692782 RepID=UPI00187F9096|nr:MULTISPECIES: ATP-binding protein [unclassified Coleofasciculus]MBE9126628.1 AAA family ATPase [Coleofasciculus sp. LEGE 07081]MBE9148880.1 AAA family ATPase [Coleofasciculus sp. LEGE 07092]